jgi:hypothetical protein
MIRKPEVSIGIGLAVATLVYAIYNRGLPSNADVRVGKPGDATIEATRRQNAWLAAGTVAGVSLIAKDPTVFIIGGSMVVALDWLTRTNNWTNIVDTLDTVNPFSAESSAQRSMQAVPSEPSYDYGGAVA